MGSYISRQELEDMIPNCKDLFTTKSDVNESKILLLEKRVEKLESIIQNNLNNEHILQQNQ